MREQGLGNLARWYAVRMNVPPTESLLDQGRVAKKQHRLKYAQSLFRKALDESRSSDNRQLRATLYAELAYVERTLRELDHSITHYLQAAEIWHELEQPLRRAHSVRHAADILREQGKQQESGRLYVEALETYRANRDSPRLDLANAIRGFALLKTQMGCTREALTLWEEARNLYQTGNIQAGVDECTAQIASLPC
jgi:tetratricopeptide (TPR) repeat protein